MFDLADRFSPRAKGVVMPQAKYLMPYSDFMNKMVLLSTDRTRFEEFFKCDRSMKVSDSEIESAFNVSNSSYPNLYLTHSIS